MADEARALWSTVDRYVAETLGLRDKQLQEVLDASEQAGIRHGSIPPYLGRFLELLVRIGGAERVLEIGTLSGYSTIWMARALPPDGRLVTLEADPRYAELARQNIAGAGLTDSVEVVVGRALDTLSALVERGAAPFDMTFIDADKKNNDAYLELVLKLSRPGATIVADNVVRGGAVADPHGEDPRLDSGGLDGLRRFYKRLGDDPRVSATAIQTVDHKGHDGFALARVNDGRSY
jgi:predicted O-methyltransferase YrrM